MDTGTSSIPVPDISVGLEMALQQVVVRHEIPPKELLHLGLPENRRIPEQAEHRSTRR